MVSRIGVRQFVYSPLNPALALAGKRLPVAATRIKARALEYEAALFKRFPSFREIKDKIVFERIIFLAPGEGNPFMRLNAASELQLDTSQSNTILNYFVFLFGHELGHKVFRNKCLEGYISAKAKYRLATKLKTCDHAFDGTVFAEIVGKGLAHPLFEKIKAKFEAKLLDELDAAYGWGITLPPHIIACLEVMANRVSYLFAPDPEAWIDAFVDFDRSKLAQYKQEYGDNKSPDIELLVTAVTMAKIGKPAYAEEFAGRFNFEFAGAGYCGAFEKLYQDVLGRFWDAIQLRA